MEEVWRPVPGYEGLYAVSSEGIKDEGVCDVTYISPRLRQDSEARKEIECKVQELHLSSIR